jgi:hypothetical protein
LVLARIAEKIDDLVDLRLDLVDPRHIVEGDANVSGSTRLFLLPPSIPPMAAC